MPSPNLPPFRVIEAALRETTERLVAELDSPTPAAPDWSPFEWAVARATTSLQGISGLLATRLRWPAPGDWLEFTTQQHAHNAARSIRAATLLDEIDALARDAGIACVTLKGAALHAAGIYRPGERPMADIDLLVQPHDVEGLARVIESLAYERLYRSRRHTVLAPIERPRVVSYAENNQHPLRIELHPRVSEELPVEVVDITDQLWPKRPTPGLNPYASRGAMLLHLLLHASGAVRAHAGRAIQIHDVAAVSREMPIESWRPLVESRSGGWWMYPVLNLAERHFPGSVPATVLTEAGDRCSRWLRLRSRRASLFDLSWSNPRITALPGIEWSRSLGHALLFARARVFPSRIALDELAQTAISQPHLMHDRWYEVSHARRLLRWLVGRARRVQTMTSLMAACAESRGLRT